MEKKDYTVDATGNSDGDRYASFDVKMVPYQSESVRNAFQIAQKAYVLANSMDWRFHKSTRT
jgi:hypothetical protein